MDERIRQLRDIKNFKSNGEIRKAINELRSQFKKKIDDDYILLINANLEESLVSSLEAQTGNKLVESKVNLDRLDEVPIKLQKETKRDATEHQTTLKR